MIRARAIAIGVLLLSYGAVGARQPAVRTAVPLPVPAADMAAALAIDHPEPSQFVLHAVRVLYDAPEGQNPEDSSLRLKLASALTSPSAHPGEKVPLPLDPSIWRETILQRNVPDAQLIAAIIADRDAALVYHGLAALDDETLGALGPDREALVHLRRNSGAFATFGRALRIKAGRVVVPGGADAEPLWSAIVGADPSRPSAFVQRLFRNEQSRLAWLYDTVAHLDPARQRLAFGGGLTGNARIERTRELLSLFRDVAAEWKVQERPFNRPSLDPPLILSLTSVEASGVPRGPNSRRMWERIFAESTANPVTISGDGLDERSPAPPIDAVWMARRIVSAGLTGRRRFETLLFAQRVFGDRPANDPERLAVATALRGMMAFPALMLTLERDDVRAPGLLAAAARHGAALQGIRSAGARRASIMQFQAVVAVVDRAYRMGGFDREDAHAALGSLFALEVHAERGYDGRLAAWIKQTLVSRPPAPAAAALGNAEASVLGAMAGWRPSAQPAGIEWEGQRYNVDPASCELRRLRTIRDRQLAILAPSARPLATLDARLASVAQASSPEARENAEERLAETLAAIVYAPYLGESNGAASASDVSARHDLGLSDPLGLSVTWRLPREEHFRGSWRVSGSLLGLDVALARLALRRIDDGEMPRAPRLSTNERITTMLSVSLQVPIAMKDQARDEIAAAIARGRARVKGLSPDRAELERVAREAGLSEWRREALWFILEQERQAPESAFSLVELFWLGGPRPSAAAAIDAWGASTLPLDGSLCLRMPAAEPWELRSGRPATGILGTRGADVALRTAEALAELRLPALLAHGVIAYAMQDAIDAAQPAYFDDWSAFERAVRAIPPYRIADYIAALTANGPLVPPKTAAAIH
jgi:hypothetical protein